MAAGGKGSDTYVLGRGAGIDTVAENDATSGNDDLLRFSGDINSQQLWFQRQGNNLEASIIGTADKVVVENWYLGSQYQVERFQSGDGKTMTSTSVAQLVSAMAAFAPPRRRTNHPA